MAVGARPAERQCETERTLAALTCGLASVREPRHVRKHFEEALRERLGAVSVEFCEDGEPFERTHSLSCELPASAPGERPCLVASFDMKRPVDDRARQTLAAAVHVAGLLLEIERASGRWPLARSGQPDGAAPLIGSSLPIRAVRDRIERVAGTDFTVLVEGPSRR